jgi:predicted N-formylglutamate amidohydrolase
MSRLLLTCEHGGNDVPKHLRPLFAGAESALTSHRGLDIGALDLFRTLRPLAQHSAQETLSRLCVEMNRSLDHPKLFSPWTRHADERQRQWLLERWHAYRDPVEATVREMLAGGERVVHVSVHSFTPVLEGVERLVDIGLLYDPSRAVERDFCRAWRKELRTALPGLRIRMNQPYKGTADGFTTWLRKRYLKGYAGVELEVNQCFTRSGRMDHGLKQGIRKALIAALGR